MRSPFDRIGAAVRNQPVLPVPRGELWLGTGLLLAAGFADTVDNHFRLAGQLGQDMVCLPVVGDAAAAPDMGYRYFEVDDLRGAPLQSDRFVAAVVDGPFQCLVNRLGLMTVLKAWIRERQELLKAYASEQAKTTDLIRRCLDLGAHGLVIADDLAAERAPLIAPADIETLCGPFYTGALEAIHGAGALGFLHSCGNIRRLTPIIGGWGFDGLAAVQHQANDLELLWLESGSKMAIMAGIEADMLDSDSPPPAARNAFERLLTAMAFSGGLILSSSCGLHSGDFLPRIRALYALADRVVGSACPGVQRKA